MMETQPRRRVPVLRAAPATTTMSGAPALMRRGAGGVVTITLNRPEKMKYALPLPAPSELRVPVCAQRQQSRALTVPSRCAPP